MNLHALVLNMKFKQIMVNLNSVTKTSIQIIWIHGNGMNHSYWSKSRSGRSLCFLFLVRPVNNTLIKFHTDIIAIAEKFVTQSTTHGWSRTPAATCARRSFLAVIFVMICAIQVFSSFFSWFLGPCPSCARTNTVSCFCGRHSSLLRCGSPSYSCKEPCGKLLSCGFHYCKELCHDGIWWLDCSTIE